MKLEEYLPNPEYIISFKKKEKEEHETRIKLKLILKRAIGDYQRLQESLVDNKVPIDKIIPSGSGLNKIITYKGNLDVGKYKLKFIGSTHFDEDTITLKAKSTNLGLSNLLKSIKEYTLIREGIDEIYDRR